MNLILLLGSVFLLPWLLIRLYAHRLRAADHLRRSITLSALGISNTEHKRLVGFFHPYWSVPRFRFHVFSSDSTQMTQVMQAVEENVSFGLL